MNKFLLAAILSGLFAPAFAEPDAAPVVTPVVAPAPAYWDYSVKKLPYSAEEIRENKNTLADGNQITTKTLVKHYRDSAGRTRTEYIHGDGVATWISIRDINGVSYSLYPSRKTATKTVAGNVLRTDSTDVPTPIKPEKAGNVYTSKTLGTREIDGLQAEGKLTTIEIPADDAGSRKPITVTTESWRSLELKYLVLYAKKTDPRSGETITRMTNIKRDEPPAALFAVPSDYKVVMCCQTQQ